MRRSGDPMKPTRVLWLVGGILVLFGLTLMMGGIWLTALGGSFYYLTAGIALLASGMLIAQRRMMGIGLYGAFLLLTVLWSFWEVGLNFWHWVPRLIVPLVIAIPVALCLPSMESDEARRRLKRTIAYVTAGACGLLLATMSVLAFVPRHIISANISRPATEYPTPANTDTEWLYYGRTAAGTRFSPADQINPSNVHALTVAWMYPVDNLPKTLFMGQQSTPLQVGETLYLCTHRNEVIALDAESGQQRWRFDPKAVSNKWWERCRGVGYYKFQDAPQGPDHPCQQRLIGSTIDARLFALDLKTGRPCLEFGVQGFVDLKVGMGNVKSGYYFQTSAPLIARDLVIIGGHVVDWHEDAMPSGVIRAFSVKTGQLIWAWDLGNPAITALPPEGQSYTRGTPNMWSTASYDDKLGLIYAPLGVATGANDLWGAWRSQEMDEYGNSIVALDVGTGRPRWHFQTVHHDLWDYDLSPQPTLFDVPDGKGGTIPALIQATKRGEIFLLDRRDGTPIVPVEEKAVPQGGQPDDWTSPTQPFSTDMPSIGAETLTEADMWGITPIDQLWCRIQFRRLRYEGLFTPPTTARTALFYPTSFGGMNWAGVSVDERRGYLIVNDIRIAGAAKLLTRADALHRRLKDGHGNPYSPIYPNVRYVVGSDVNFTSPFVGSPCNGPPWGTMTAIDLTTRKIVWQIPMGTARDGAAGAPLRLPVAIGLPTLGGTLTTQSGLIFFAGTQDHYLRALDILTGNELWKGRLPIGSQATPMTYISPKSGRQFVVVVAGGSGRENTRGTYVIAYALPTQS